MTQPATPTPRFDTFYRYDALTRLLFDYADAHPTLVSVASIGKSFEGRDIWVATEPLTTDETWHPFAPGEMRVFVGGVPQP